MEEKKITKKYIRDKLEALTMIFAKASIGDFSQDIVLPEDEDEFSELYAGVQIMQEVIREKISELQQLNYSLEQKVEQRTREVAEKEALYRTVVENINDGLIITDFSDRILYVNSRMAEMSGYSVDELLGETAYKMWLPENEWPVLQKRIKQRAKGVSDNYELKMLNKRGMLWWADVRASPVYDSRRKIIATLGAVTDITKRKLAEQSQVSLMKELKRSNEELSNFAYIVSHDLKAPLRGINFLADILVSDYADKFDQEGRNYINLITDRVDRMKNLIEGILEYSRIGRKADIKEIDLNELVHHLIGFISLPSTINIHIKNVLPKVTGEPTQLSQVFQNLIDNAIKYNDKPAGEVNIFSSEDQDNWIFSISDNGPGIDPAYYEDIFKIFHTLDTSPSSTSTGIGLSIVKKVVEFHGGKIKVDSEPGNGSTFTFTLPKNPPEQLFHH